MRPIRLSAILTVLLGLAGAAPADHVHLTNGQVLRGRVVERTADEVQVRLPFLSVTLPAAQVDKVVAEPVEVYVLEIARDLLASGEADKARLFLTENHPAQADTPELRRLAALATGWADGLAKTEAMDFEGAAEAFRIALEAEPGHAKVEAARTKLDETRAHVEAHGYMPGDDRRLETKNLTVVHRHPIEAEALGQAIEALLRPVEQELSAGENHALRLQGKVVVFLCETRERFVEVAGEEHARRPAAVLSPYRIAIPRGFAGAELRPLVTRLVASHMYPVLPPWAEEGMVAGGLARKPADVYDPVREAYAKGTAYGLEELLETRSALDLPEDRRNLFVLQSRALVDLLSHDKGSKTKLRQVLRDAQIAVTRDLQQMMKDKDGMRRVEGGFSLQNLAREKVVTALLDRYRHADLAALEKELKRYLRVAERDR